MAPPSPPPILKEALLARLATVHGLEARPSPVAGGTALFFHGREFAHFHHAQEIDVQMGRPLIQTLGLKAPGDSIQHPRRAPVDCADALRPPAADAGRPAVHHRAPGRAALAGG